VVSTLANKEIKIVSVSSGKVLQANGSGVCWALFKMRRTKVFPANGDATVGA
jgi:hypothetical protein